MAVDNAQDTEAQARAHLRAAEKHASKAAEHRLAAGAYHKNTPAALTTAQAEWAAVSAEARQLQRRGIHTSTEPRDVQAWLAHCERHRAALEAMSGGAP